MSRAVSKSAAILLSLSLACAVPPLLARKKEKEKSAPTLQDQKRALHALNRLTFGPRPGDVQFVTLIGVDQWIDQQLHPERVDDSALNARLEPLRTTRMSTRELAENFPDGQEINQVMNGKRPMPGDPALRMVYQVQIERQRAKKERSRDAGNGANAAVQNVAVSVPPANPSAGNALNPAEAAGGTSRGENPEISGAMKAGSGTDSVDGADTKAFPEEGNMVASAAAKMTPEEEEQARRREEQLYADLQVQQLASLPPDQRFKKVLSMSTEQQISFADSLRGGKGQVFLAGLPPRQKEILQSMNNPAGVVTSELAQAKLLRAVYSNRQLEEVMTDFWFNHFNVYVDKGVDRLMISSYERDVIRPHALGKFEDLLVATAKSPAMLFYLDNWLSVGPNSLQALGIPEHPRSPYNFSSPRPKQGKRPSGLNENYGRELMELHTLSVNGGYTQRDVTEAAKVFTGWTIDKPFQGGGFKFDPRTHEPGPKFVLGHKIKPKGEGEGLELLHRLATSPQTAHFISLKLAERFVSDDPPPALVDRMAKTFLKKKGDIREVLLVLFHSPEFWDDGNYRAKVKTPLEFVVSAARATGAEIEDAQPLVGQLNRMGMPLYGAQPPTGYSMKAATWVSSSALLNRMNFALALTSGKIKGVQVDVTPLAASNPQDAAARHAEVDPADLTRSASDANVPAPSVPGPSVPSSSIPLSALEVSLLEGDVSKQTHDSILAQIDAGTKNSTPRQDSKSGARKPGSAARSTDAATIAGLLLGSPEFQKR